MPNTKLNQVMPFVDPYDDNGGSTHAMDNTSIPPFSSSFEPKEGEYSVTNFENDAEVQKAFTLVADYLAENRGLGSLALDQSTTGEQTDVAEFMRDDVARLGAPITKANILKDAPENVKAGYRLMQDRFEKSELTGVGEHLSAIKDYTIDTIFNPEMLATGAAIISAIPTGGTSVAARGAVGVAAKKGAKKYLADALAITKATATTNPLKASSIMGATYGGAGSLVVQDLDVAIDKRERISVGEVAQSVGVGAIFGAGLYGATKVGQKYFAKGTSTTDEIPVTPDLFDEAVEGDFIPASATELIEQLDLLSAGKIKIEDINVDKFVADIGGGEKTQAEIRAAIRAAVAEETTAEGVKNRFKQEAYKTVSSLSGNLFGKAAGVLSPYTALSGTAKILQSKFSHEFGISWKRSTKIVEKDLGEVQREVTGRFNEKFRAIVEDISLHAAKGTLAEDVNDLLMIALRSNKPATKNGLDTELNKSINKAAGEIRALYKEMGVGLNEIGVIDKLVDNYIPRMWDRKSIEANPEKLAELLETKGGYAKGTGMKTVEDMLAIKDQIDAGGSGGHFFSAKRKLNQIENDADFQEFLNSDVLGSLHAYTFQAGKSIAKHRVLGVNTLGEFQKVWTAKITKELAKKGEKMTAAEIKQIDKLYQTATGEGMERWGKKVQTGLDTYGFVNRVAMLGLATLSSITEIFLNVSKVGFKNSAKGFAEAMEISFKGVTKDLEVKLQTNHNLTAKEAFSEMRKYSINMDQAMAQMGNRLAGDDLMNDWMQDKSNKFFRLTLLDQWTKFVQTTSYASGKNLIQENLEALAANGTRKLDRYHETMAGELAELGIDYKQGVEWLKAGGSLKDSFYDEQVLGGAARYSNSVVLQPTAMSGLKPLLFSNPKTAIAFQLLGYPVAFTNTVMKGAAKSLGKAPIRNAAKIIPAAAIMTGMARWTNYVRSDGESEKGREKYEIYYNAIARWGGNGILLDSFNRARTSALYTQSSLPYFTMAMGPLGSDSLKLMKEGIIPLVGGKIPLYSGSYFGKQILGKDKVKEYKKLLRDAQQHFITDELVLKFGESGTRLQFDKGGEVMVPNAPAEPDERIDKMTGQPYNRQAGSAFMDETDPFKVLMNSGGSVTREKYNVGRVVIGQATKEIIDFVSPTATNIAKSVENLFNRETINNAANKVDNAFYDAMDVNNLDPEDIMVQSYADALVVNALEGQNHKSIYELEQIPEWRKAIENTDSSVNEKLWAEAQQKMGISERKREALQTIRDLQNEYDPDAALESVVPNNLGNLSNEYERVKINISEEEISKVDMSKYDEKTLENIEDFLRTVVKQEADTLSDEGLETVVERNIIKLIASGEVDFAKFKAPSLTSEVYPNITPATKSIEAHIATSTEKNPVFRGLTSFTEAEFDVAFAFSREVGVHVGTEGQATTFLIRALPDTALKQQFKQEIDSGVMTKEKMDSFFTDPDLISGDYQPTISGATSIVDDMPIDSGYFGNFAEGDELLKPLTIKRGYIDVRNPLLIESDLSGWEAETILKAGGGFDEYFMPEILSRGIELSKKQTATLEKLESRAEMFPWDTTQQSPKISDSIKSKMQRAEINTDFRAFLEDLGFDSIKYRNEVEMSLKGEEAYSYIIFKPEQFKVTTGRLVDTQERLKKAEGGEVYNIESGDTLSGIARKYGTTVDQLAADNSIADVNMIYAGKSLKVPTLGKVDSQAPIVSKPATDKAKALDRQVKEAFEAAETVVDKGVDIVADTANSGVEALQTLKDSASSEVTDTARRASSAVKEGAADLSDIVESASESVSEVYTGIKETTTSVLSALKRLTTVDTKAIRESVATPEPDLSEKTTTKTKGIKEAVATPETDLSNLPDVASKVGNAYEDLKSLLSKATENLTASINEPSPELPNVPTIDDEGIREAVKAPVVDLTSPPEKPEKELPINLQSLISSPLQQALSLAGVNIDPLVLLADQAKLSIAERVFGKDSYIARSQSDDITEKDLSSQVVEAMRTQAIDMFKTGGRGINDSSLLGKGEKRSDVLDYRKAASFFTNPTKSISLITGETSKSAFTLDKDNNLILNDVYDFPDYSEELIKKGSSPIYMTIHNMFEPRGDTGDEGILSGLFATSAANTRKMRINLGPAPKELIAALSKEGNLIASR